MHKSEAELQREILLHWGSHPRLRLWRQNVGAAMLHGRMVRFGTPGAPDIMGVMSPSGRFVGIEVKSATGKQTDEQKTWERVFAGMGGVYVLARTLDDVARVLIPLVGAP